MKRTANKSADVALMQVRRLKAKPFYPVAELEDGKPVNHGEKELARTLFGHCESDQHMSRVIDAAVIRRFGDAGQDRCPSPHDIWALCRDVNPAPPIAVPVNPDCELCEGTGYQFVRKAFGVTGVARCPNNCAVAGYEFRRDAISAPALRDWYQREEQTAATRRQSHSTQRRGLRAPRVTDADIAALAQQQQASRQARQV